LPYFSVDHAGKTSNPPPNTQNDAKEKKSDLKITGSRTETRGPSKRNLSRFLAFLAVSIRSATLRSDRERPLSAPDKIQRKFPQQR
jgi:hypothetical protein